MCILVTREHTLCVRFRCILLNVNLRTKDKYFVEQRNREISPALYENYSKLQNVIYFRLYSDFIREGRRCPALEAGHTKPADWERMEVETTENLRRLCQQLPHYHLKTLGFLCHHLNRISLNSEVNNMPSSNLAIGSFFLFFSHASIESNNDQAVQ